MKTVKCKVVMRHADGKAVINKGLSKEGKLVFYQDVEIENDEYNQKQHLYIVSEDEIKDDDWIYSPHLGVYQYEFHEDSLNLASKLIISQYKKIIASTDPSLNLPQLPNDFLQEYCEKGGIDEVLVEYEDYFDQDAEQGDDWGHKSIKSIPKVNADNTLSIKFCKSTWNREEIEEIVTKIFHEVHKGDLSMSLDIVDLTMSPKEWCDKNL